MAEIPGPRLLPVFLILVKKVVDNIDIISIDISIINIVWITDLFCGNLDIGVERDDLVGSPIEGEGVADFLVYEGFG